MKDSYVSPFFASQKHAAIAAAIISGLICGMFALALIYPAVFVSSYVCDLPKDLCEKEDQINHIFVYSISIVITLFVFCIVLWWCWPIGGIKNS